MTHRHILDITDHHLKGLASIGPPKQMPLLGIAATSSSTSMTEGEKVLVELFFEKAGEALVKRIREALEHLENWETGPLPSDFSKVGVNSPLVSFFSVETESETLEERKARLVEILRAKLSEVERAADQDQVSIEAEKDHPEAPKKADEIMILLGLAAIKKCWPKDFKIEQGSKSEVPIEMEIPIIKTFISSFLVAIGKQSRIQEFIGALTRNDQALEQEFIVFKQTLNRILGYGAKDSVFRTSLRNSSQGRTDLIKRILKALSL